MNTSQASTAEESNDAHYRLHGLPLVGVVVALFLALLMAALDGTIVDTATPRIIRSRFLPLSGDTGHYFLLEGYASSSGVNV